MKTCQLSLLAACLTAAVGAADAWAGVGSRAVAEVVEMLVARGAVRAAEAATLAGRIERLSLRYGEDALLAVRKAGPAAVELLEGAGADGPKVVGVLARWGEQGATRVLSRPAAMSQFLRYGDDAAAVLVRHPGVAEPLLERGGIQAVRALEDVSAQNGRRLAMLFDGELAGAAGRHPELLEVVARHGDPAVNFLWRNKEVLAGGAALTAFLANPEPFLAGARDLAQVATDGVVKPVVGGVVTLTTTMLIIAATLALAGAAAVARYGLPDPKQAVRLVRWWRCLKR